MRHVHFDTTDSTNAQARLLAATYPGEILLVTASEQTAGRGRQGRIWQSPPGGAWMTVVWPIRKAPSAYAATSLVAALAVARALNEVAPQCASDLQIKWPNDLLLGGRKVAGILCELCPLRGGSRPGALIIGVGINVDFEAAQLIGRLRHPATTLRTFAGCALAVDDVIEAITGQLLESMAAFEADGLSDAILSELRSRLAYIGTVQQWAGAGRQVTGRVRGVDDFGRLVLECENCEVACDAGELLSDAVVMVEKSV